ncbi:B12-binding domain-containing radical SAM protein, partial [Spirochaetota bacterium]
ANGVTMNINKSIDILRDYKSLKPDIITVMGGPHVTFDAHNILKDHKHVDFIIRREGELTLIELLKNISDGGSFKKIRGLSFREGENIIHNADRPLIDDINILPGPELSLIKLSKYKALGTSVNMITSRGCPFKCIFCVGSKMVGQKVRYYDVQRVVDEFERLSTLGFKQINIADDLFTSNKKRCITICNEIIKRGIKHKWTAFARVDTVTEELLQVLKKAGCTTLCFGIESGDQKILDKINKRISLGAVKKAIEQCKNAKIGVMASYILGLPGETRETANMTMAFAKELCNSYGYHILAPFPGTEVREKYSEYGIKIFTDDWDKYDANQSVCESEFLSHEEVDRIVMNFNSEIDGAIKFIMEKFENGEELSKLEYETISGIKSFKFVEELIKKDLLNGNKCTKGDGKESVLREIGDYISEITGMNTDTVSLELERLLELNCIEVKQIKDSKSIEWI